MELARADARAMASSTPCITIDKGIPMPAPRGVGRQAKYPWAAMEVGDSFAIPMPAENKNVGNFRRSMCMWAKRHGTKFSSRARDENGKRVLRVWRIA